MIKTAITGTIAVLIKIYPIKNTFPSGDILLTKIGKRNIISTYRYVGIKSGIKRMEIIWASDFLKVVD